MRQSEVIAGVITPLIVASTMVTYLIDIFKKLNDLEKRIRKIANFDQTTSLGSRLALLESSENLFNLAKRCNRNLGILMLDIDHFKYINDKYGHLKGDAILHSMGNIINSTKRETDLAGRYGGDEMIIFLPEADLNGCQSFAEKLIEKARAFQMETSNGVIKFTISIGISVLSESFSFCHLGELIESADTALYKAKNLGRDQYSIYKA